MTKQELERFRRLLLKHRALIKGDIKAMENESLGKSFQDATGEVSSMPVHIADISAENYEQEFAVELLQNKGEIAEEIEEALARIDEGTYGICEECGRPIKKQRLLAIPYARLCIECQREKEARERRS